MSILIEYQYFGNFNLYKSLYKTRYIIFEQCENYQKSSFRNKMVLASPTGPLFLSIPVLGGRGVKANIADIQIDHRVKWQNNHIKTICNLYNRSPWFEFYKDDLELLYVQQFEKLVDWNLACFNWVLSKLKLDVNLSVTKTFQFNTTDSTIIDLRDYTVKKQEIAPYHQGYYNQLFMEKIGFLPNICILDLLFCEGPNAINVLSTA